MDIERQVRSTSLSRLYFGACCVQTVNVARTLPTDGTGFAHLPFCALLWNLENGKSLWASSEGVQGIVDAVRSR